MMLPLFQNADGTVKTTKGGSFIHKHRVRATFRAISFLTLVVTVCLINSYIKYDQSQFDHYQQHRHLEENSNGEAESNWNGLFMKKAQPLWLLVPHVIGVLYMFLALAIVCDEYFVPALEVMSGELHLNLTPDISGATLMAAGGSAPELFTSFIGTFQKSEVGFGTIVGSAVFNVLFVIGMCSLLSKDVLELTWWPLFRDTTYYAIGLLVLAIFVGVVTPAVITWWEAFVLFMMYIGYIYVMSVNEQLYEYFSGGDTGKSDAATAMSSGRSITFRAGLLTKIRGRYDSWVDKARIGFVAQVAGDFDDVFDFVDENGDGTISREEIRLFFTKVYEEEREEVSISDSEIDEIMAEIDTNGDGMVTKTNFRDWYIKSEEHIKVQIKKLFDAYDFDKSGGIYQLEFKTMLQEVQPKAKTKAIDLAVKQCYKDNQEYELKFDEFAEWYFQSTWCQKYEKPDEEDDVKTVLENLCPPQDAGCFGYLRYIFLFPLVATMTLTIPDVRRPGLDEGYYCYFAFLISICWIGVYSYFMVGWTETIGATLGIDTFIMGLTFLAAGTSVPDLLSSVIVARMGEGDMAVSSSIGSNIFDILVGLPVPWLAFALWPTMPKTVTIGAEGVWISIMILLGMLVLIIGSIHFSGWRLTKPLGFLMFFFYFCFLAQAIIRYIFF